MSDISQININNTTYNFKDAEGRTQVEIMPAASADLLGKIIQYAGNDTDDYKNGYFYKCVADETTEPISYKWVQTDVQPDGGETQVQSDWEQTDTEAVDFIKNKPTLGTASAKDVATSGNASATQVVMGNDSRLTDARNAADVSAWAKAGTKPTYTASEVGLGNVVNTGDSATPVANGTTKFTTGGAYTELNKKVDKEEGKGLSSNDFTDDDKTAILNSAILSTSTASPITDSTDGLVQGLTIYGRSEVTESDNLFNPVGLIKAGWNKNADGSYSGNVRDLHTAYVSGYKPSIAFKPQTQYTLSFDCHSASTSQSLIAGFYSRDSGGTAHWNQVVVSASSYTHYTLTSPADQTVEYIAFSFENNQTAYIKNFIVSEGSQEHEYEPYPYVKSIGDSGSITVTLSSSKSSSATFTTALPLRGVSETVRDKLICTAESKQVEKVCEEVDLGAFEWEYVTDGNTPVFKNITPISSLTVPNFSTSLPMICARYDTSKSWIDVLSKTDMYGYLVPRPDGRVGITDNNYTNATEFKAAMSGVMLIYKLAEPVTTPLTTAEISSFRSLRTFDSTTNITISDEPEPEFELDYLKNSDNGQAVANIQRNLQGQINEVKNTTKPRVYAFYVDQNDSNPATCVHPYYNTKYGCDNLFYQNAYMDYEKDEFNYGSWEDFIKEFFKPCMLAYDGHVDYYLDPDDYETKLDGGTSDIKDMTYNGNVMVQIKTLYFKRWTTGGKYYCIISDKKLDKSFKAFAHHDIKGNVLDYIYRAAYDGSYDGTRLRSISGIDYHNANALTVNKIMSNTTRQQEIDFAKANNDANEQGEGWNILHKAEWDLINDLLLLIGMSTNTQATFGNGNISSYVSISNTGIIATGTMDKKGLFYGKNDNVSGVKVFGIEMPWGNIWKSCLGWILSANQHLVKMTPGNEDGSTASDYNLDGAGYVATGKSITANGYISAFDGADTGFLPTAASGSATTYMCDYEWQNTTTYFALVGGYSDDGARCGAFYAGLSASATAARWYIGTALSYKPLARG